MAPTTNRTATKERCTQEDRAKHRKESPKERERVDSVRTQPHGKLRRHYRTQSQDTRKTEKKIGGPAQGPINTI